mmetsp:Transcript_84109/g.271872  ORF Transcript_84109/g.271872 Transcript_84109/m.271872 type:complete len:215 (+) Transcript_84109:159-803(+)
MRSIPSSATDSKTPQPMIKAIAMAPCSPQAVLLAWCSTSSCASRARRRASAAMALSPHGLPLASRALFKAISALNIRSANPAGRSSNIDIHGASEVMARRSAANRSRSARLSAVTVAAWTRSSARRIAASASASTSATRRSAHRSRSEASVEFRAASSGGSAGIGRPLCSSLAAVPDPSPAADLPDLSPATETWQLRSCVREFRCTCGCNCNCC